VIRWVTTDEPVDDSILPPGARLATDVAGKTVVLFQDQWSCDFFAQRNPKIGLSPLPVGSAENQEVVGLA